VLNPNAYRITNRRAIEVIELLEGRFFKTFLAVMEEKSFSRAADKLGYVQSTVTSHIKILEQICKQKLFHRLARGVDPTEAGIKLAKYANQFIHLGNSIEEVMNGLDQPRGIVTLRMQESFFLTRMTEVLQLFKQEHPMVKLRIESGFHQDIMNQVLNHAVDFGIVPRDPQRHELLFFPLVEEKLIFVASESLFEEVQSKGLERLNEEIIISFGTSCLYDTHTRQILQESGVHPFDALELPSLEMIKQSVKQAIGFALVPEVSVQDELESGELITLSIGPAVRFMHGLVVHKDRELNYPAKLFKSRVIVHFETIHN
jgi:DNA-binding transcriptional LysR family regulator